MYWGQFSQIKIWDNFPKLKPHVYMIILIALIFQYEYTTIYLNNP